MGKVLSNQQIRNNSIGRPGAKQGGVTNYEAMSKTLYNNQNDPTMALFASSHMVS